MPALPGGRRIAMWLRHPLKHRLRQPVDTAVWGQKLRLMPRGNLSESRWLFTPQFADRKERLFLRSKLKPDSTFIDIGANAGFYSFWACQSIGQAGCVVSVEPDPELRRRIQFNSTINGLENRINLAPVALSDQPGSMRLSIGGKNRGQNQLVAEGDEHGESIEVAVTTLPALCSEHAIEQIDALKIDIEGHEHQVMSHFFDQSPESLWPRHILFENCLDVQERSMMQLCVSRGYHQVCRARMNTIVTR